MTSSSPSASVSCGAAAQYAGLKRTLQFYHDDGTKMDWIMLEYHQVDVYNTPDLLLEVLGSLTKQIILQVTSSKYYSEKFTQFFYVRLSMVHPEFIQLNQLVYRLQHLCYAFIFFTLDVCSLVGKHGVLQGNPNFQRCDQRVGKDVEWGRRQQRRLLYRQDELNSLIPKILHSLQGVFSYFIASIQQQRKTLHEHQF